MPYRIVKQDGQLQLCILHYKSPYKSLPYRLQGVYTALILCFSSQVPTILVISPCTLSLNPLFSLIYPVPTNPEVLLPNPLYFPFQEDASLPHPHIPLKLPCYNASLCEMYSDFSLFSS